MKWNELQDRFAEAKTRTREGKGGELDKFTGAVTGVKFGFFIRESTSQLSSHSLSKDVNTPGTNSIFRSWKHSI